MSMSINPDTVNNKLIIRAMRLNPSNVTKFFI